MSESTAATGRSRGRARGRARGGTSEATQKRPGDAPPTQDFPPPGSAGRGRSRGAATEAPQPANGSNGAAPAAATGGRSSHRGGARQSDVKGVSTQMAEMSLGTGDARAGGRGRFSRNDDDCNCKPAHITDKKGSSGQPMGVVANCFKVTQNRPGWFLYQYCVSYKPPIENKGLRIALLNTHKEMIGNTRAFDGMQLFLPHKLPNDPMVFTAMRNYDNQPIEITIKMTNELPSTSPTTIQILNIIFRRDLAIVGMRQIGRQYFNPNMSISIEEHKMEVWPGFATSIRPYEKDVMLCLDLSHKVLRKATVLDLMYDIRSTKPERYFKDECIKQIVGEIVLTKYNNKTYRVDDIDFDQNPTSSFNTTKSGAVKYVDYYAKSHSKPISDLEQPLLMSLPKKKDVRAGQEGPIYLIPELCYLTGLSDNVRSDFRVMRDLAQHTRIGPGGRCQRLQGFISELSNHPQVKEEMENWGLSFAKELVNIQARILPPEKVFQHNKNLSYKQQDAEWSRDMRGARLITPCGLTNWAVLSTQRDSAAAKDMASTLQRVGGPMGMNMDTPEFVILQDDRTDTYVRTLARTITKNTQLVVCVVPTNRKDRYDAIKKMCCVQHPVPSQVIVTRTISKKQMLMSVCTKVAIQMNCKLGGDVWGLEIPLNNTMVVGIDTYHERKQRSVGGFVASTNKLFTKYYSRASIFDSKQEIHDHLKVMMTAGLENYHQENGTLPERIFVFRDGVGDGQLDIVHSQEVPTLMSAFKGFSNYDPKLAILVVKKRLSTRFFLQSRGEYVNPPPGTIVDSEVTRSNWYDFFVISQSVRQGTVSPTHFNVIHDTSALRPDHLQRLAYKLTHLYYNWPGTIRVPAPCQYAHKLAFLVGQSLKDTPSPHLCDRLFYL